MYVCMYLFIYLFIYLCMHVQFFSTVQSRMRLRITLTARQSARRLGLIRNSPELADLNAMHFLVYYCLKSLLSTPTSKSEGDLLL